MTRHRLLMVVLPALVLAACQAREPNEPVVSAVASNNVEKVRQYLAEGGDPNLKSRDGKPLIFVATGARGGEEVADLLIKAGANLNAPTAEGRTALQGAAGWCDVEMVRLLLDAGANAGLTDGEGKTARELVCVSPLDRRDAVIELLRAAGG